jgi:hypothetical protein
MDIIIPMLHLKEYGLGQIGVYTPTHNFTPQEVDASQLVHFSNNTALQDCGD